VREQHAEGHFLTAGVLFFVEGEFGDYGGDWGFEIQQAAFIEEHRHGGGRDYFG